nr:hypothetical protein [Tanacetum cinerariifolium]
GPNDTQYCMENPEQAFVECASLCTDEAGDPQCLTQIHGSINTITVYQSNPYNDKQEEDERKRKGNPKNIDATERREEQRDTSQPDLKKSTAIDKIGSSRNDEEIEWLGVEEPLDLVDTREESVYESLIKEMPKCSLNYDFRIRVTQETLKSLA